MERVISVEVDQVDPGRVRLTFRYPDAAADPPFEVDQAEIDDLLTRAEVDYYAPLPEDPEKRVAWLEGLGKRLFTFLDRPERHVSGYLEGNRGSRDVVVLALAVSQGLARLPWELLHDGTSFLVAAPYAVVPVRRVPGCAGARPPRKGAMRLLFMASAPTDVAVPLDYEWEEAQIREATRGRSRVDIQIEESGNLQEFQRLIESDGPEDGFDVVHLTGHASHTREEPRFLTETAVGGRLDASAEDLANALWHRAPALLFLSGCRTAEDADAGAIPSLARELIDKITTPIIIGWGRPVVDSAATQAASALYRSLARGLTPAQALADTYRSLLIRKSRRGRAKGTTGSAA